MSDGLKDALKNCNVISNNTDGTTFHVQKTGNHSTKITLGGSGIGLQEGTKYDQGKPRLDLLPPTLLTSVAEILTFGAKKYAAHNWRKGINYSRIYSSLQRHLNSFQAGEEIDPESGKPHLWHAGCNIAFLIEFESKPEQYKEFDDRYKPEGEDK